MLESEIQGIAPLYSWLEVWYAFYGQVWSDYRACLPQEWEMIEISQSSRADHQVYRESNCVGYSFVRGSSKIATTLLQPALAARRLTGKAETVKPNGLGS